MVGCFIKNETMKKLIITAIATTGAVIWLGYLLLAALYGQYWIVIIGLAIMALAFKFAFK